MTVTGAKTFTYTVANTGATDGYVSGSYVAPNWTGNGASWYPLGTTSFWRNVAGSRWNTDSVNLTNILYLNNNNFIYSGLNSPEGVLEAPVGSLWLRTNGGAGTTLYIKESGTGNTGWVGK